MISITLNGNKKDVPEGTLLNLLAHLNLKPEWTIVEHNGEAISRDCLDQKVLQQNDSIEIIRAVAGG